MYRILRVSLVASALLNVVLGTRPNILLLLTDDQDTLIGGIDHMPLLRTLLVEQGTTFSNAFVHTPVCCPSRSSIFTGRYLHNIPMKNNSASGNCNGKTALKNKHLQCLQNKLATKHHLLESISINMATHNLAIIAAVERTVLVECLRAGIDGWGSRETAGTTTMRSLC